MAAKTEVPHQLEARILLVGALRKLEAVASRPPLIVLLGDANSGKTTLANRLIGAGPLVTGVLSNTRHPTLVRHADAVEIVAWTAGGRRFAVTDDGPLPDEPLRLVEVGYPSANLRACQVLDTPGGYPLDDVARLPAPPPVLIAVWCTAATQAWKSSEIRQWTAVDRRLRRHSMLVATGLDRITSPDDRARLAGRLAREAQPHFDALGFAAKSPHDRADAVSMLRDTAGRLLERRAATARRIADRINRAGGAAKPPPAGKPGVVVGLSKGGAA